MTTDRSNGDTTNNRMLAAGAGNLLLSVMTPADHKCVMRSATREQLPRGTILTEADEAASAIYFIEHGVASVIALRPDAEKTEIALIGPESFVGAPVVIGDGRWPYQTFVQVDQLSMIRWPIDDARAALDSSRSLARLLTHAAYTQMVQVAEGLISMAWQRLDARLARWLLMYRDRLRSDRLEVTHEFMALMVGVQRTGVTEALHTLEGQGLISATRGVVIIRNPQGLRQLAGHGYGITDREYDRLLRPQAVLSSDQS